MIRPPSLTKPYAEHFSEDPAFLQLATDATDEQKADYRAKLTAASETGNWTPLRVDGAGEPTTFTMRPLPSDAYGKLVDLQRAGMGNLEAHELVFRISLQAVTNLGDAKVKFVDDDRFGRIASLSVFEDAGITGALGVRIMLEIGERVLMRASGLSGK